MEKAEAIINIRLPSALKARIVEAANRNAETASSLLRRAAVELLRRQRGHGMVRGELAEAAATGRRVIKLELTNTPGVRTQVGQGSIVEKHGDGYWFVPDAGERERVDLDALECYEFELVDPVRR